MIHSSRTASVLVRILRITSHTGVLMTPRSALYYLLMIKTICDGLIQIWGFRCIRAGLRFYRCFQDLEGMSFSTLLLPICFLQYYRNKGDLIYWLNGLNKKYWTAASIRAEHVVSTIRQYVLEESFFSQPCKDNYLCFAEFLSQPFTFLHKVKPQLSDTLATSWHKYCLVLGFESTKCYGDCI